MGMGVGVWKTGKFWDRVGHQRTSKDYTNYVDERLMPCRGLAPEGGQKCKARAKVEQ
jgi:hypothetical protein